MTQDTSLLLDTTQPQETTPGDKTAKPNKNAKLIAGVRYRCNPPGPWADTPPKQRKKYHPPGGSTQNYCSYLTAVPIYLGSTHHGERRQYRTSAAPFAQGRPIDKRGCGPGEASCPGTVCWRVSTHERGHDRFVLRPSANHPCRTFASNSGSSARRASRGNACHASHCGKSYASHSDLAVPAQLIALLTQASAAPGSVASAAPSHPAAAAPATLIVITPLRSGVGVPRVPHTTHCTPITPPRYHPRYY